MYVYFMAYTEYFNSDLAKEIETKMKLVDSDFSMKKEKRELDKELKGKKLKERNLIIAQSFQEAFLALKKQPRISEMKIFYGPVLETETGIFNEGYWLMPVSSWIEHFLSKQPVYAFEQMYELTQRNTAEFCIRPFLENNYPMSMEYLRTWVKDPSFHIRRLVSEGLRPKLPWARKLNFTTDQIQDHLSLLDRLSNDPILYVRKSVANHLRDLIKDHSQLTFEFCKNLSHGSKNQKWILRHSLRGNLTEKAKYQHYKELKEKAKQ
jgi:3-methyladenine DNA glycosylase AlkC